MTYDRTQGRPPRGCHATTTQRSVRFTDDELEALQAHAYAERTSLAGLIRDRLRRDGLFAMPEGAA